MVAKDHSNLDIFKARFSRQETLAILAICVVPLHFWSSWNMFNDIPAWVLYLDAWDLAGMISYTLTFTMLESLLVFGILIGFALVIPANWIKGRYPAIALLLISAGLVFAFVSQNLIQELRGSDIPLVVVLFLVITALALIPIRRSARLQSYALRFGSALLVLAFIYVAIDIISVFIVMIRNI